jgi:hypothetical protein
LFTKEFFSSPLIVILLGWLVTIRVWVTGELNIEAQELKESTNKMVILFTTFFFHNGG